MSISSNSQSSKSNKSMLQCQHCGKQCISKSILEKHERTHTKEKPFKCDYENCTAAFTQKQNLKRHLQWHNNQKDFECTLCKKKFLTLWNLQLHQKSHQKKLEKIAKKKEKTKLNKTSEVKIQTALKAEELFSEQDNEFLQISQFPQQPKIKYEEVLPQNEHYYQPSIQHLVYNQPPYTVMNPYRSENIETPRQYNFLQNHFMHQPYIQNNQYQYAYPQNSSNNYQYQTGTMTQSHFSDETKALSHFNQQPCYSFQDKLTQCQNYEKESQQQQCQQNLQQKLEEKHVTLQDILNDVDEDIFSSYHQKPSQPHNIQQLFKNDINNY